MNEGRASVRGLSPSPCAQGTRSIVLSVFSDIPNPLIIDHDGDLAYMRHQSTT